MEVQALTRYARMSPKKVREVVRTIQGRKATDAVDYLTLIPRKSAKLIAKTLKSAIANAENNNNLSADALTVKSAIVENGPVASYVIDSNHRVTHWNAACAQLTGRSATLMLGSNEAWRAFYEEARPTLAELIVDGQVEAEGPLHYGLALNRSPLLDDSYAYEGYFPQLGPEGRWLQVTAAPLRGIDGQVMGAIETLQDVTTRHQAEEQLRCHQAELESMVAQRTAELRLTHQELEAFLENASVGIIATRELHIARSNKKFAEILELPDDLPVSEMPLRRFFLDDGDFHELGQLATQALRAGTSLAHEMCLQTWTGRRIWVQLIAYASTPTDGVPGMWWLLQDHSEVMRAQEELVNNYRNIQETNARLEEAQNQLLQSEKMASIGQLAAGVAHEINNPIGFVNSNLGTLRRYVEQLLALINTWNWRRGHVDAILALGWLAVRYGDHAIELMKTKGPEVALAAVGVIVLGTLIYWWSRRPRPVD